MKFNFSREWLKWAAETEDGCEVGAGVMALASSERCREERDRITHEPVGPQASQSDQDRLRFYIQLLIGDWGKVVTRAALDGGLILMLDDDLRAALLGRRTRSRKSRAEGVEIDGLDYILQELQMSGRIEIDNGHLQQRLTLVEPFREPVSPVDQRRLHEMKQVFENQRQLGRVVETEEVLDAHLELVSA